MKAAAALGAVVLALVWTAPAWAQDTSTYSDVYSFGLGPPNAKHLVQRTVTLKVSGAITVDFHSDAATGCATLDGCAYHGRLIWTPAGGGLLLEASYTAGGRRHSERALSFGTDNPFAGAATYADVIRDGSSASAGECVDEQSAGGFTGGIRRGSTFTFALSRAVAPTRCAGPLPGDLGGALPVITLPAMIGQGEHIDASGTKSFAAHGFAGTVTSTLAITVGGAQNQSGAIPQGIPPGVPKPTYRRFREVTVPIVGVQASGSLTARLTGSRSTDVCLLLDSCGIAGTLTIAPSPGPPTGAISAEVPVSRPLKDVLTALGLTKGGRTAGISVLGTVTWAERGTVSTDVIQAGTCRDAAPLASGYAEFVAHGVKSFAEYLPGGEFGQGGPRTRCPGPFLWQSFGAVADAFSPKEVGRRTFSVAFTAGGPQNDDGYDAQASGRVTLTFRRGNPMVTIRSEPTG